MGRSGVPLEQLLDELAAALQALEGLELAMSFDDDDPASLEAAICAVEAAIDARVAAFRGNELVASAIADIKTQFRTGFLERAAGTQRSAGPASASGGVDEVPPALH